MSTAEELFPNLIRTHHTVDGGHGRVEERTLKVVEARTADLGFPDIAQIGCLSRKREILKTGKRCYEEVYLITSLNAQELPVEEFMTIKRGYWSIENRLHYRKDFVFNEDRSTIRAGNGPENMAALVNFALAVMSLHKVENVKRCVNNLRHFSPYDCVDTLLAA